MGMIEDKDIDLHIDRETLLQEYIPRAEFEQRLKADLKAILVELQLEIEEKEREVEFMDEYSNGYNSCLFEISRLIQQKINALKEDKNELSIL